MNYLEKTKESYNSYYKQYKAAWCKKSGLPMYTKNDWGKIEKDELYSVTRAMRAKVEIDKTAVCAWYRLANGYIPLFKRKEQQNEQQ